MGYKHMVFDYPQIAIDLALQASLLSTYQQWYRHYLPVFDLPRRNNVFGLLFRRTKGRLESHDDVLAKVELAPSWKNQLIGHHPTTGVATHEIPCGGDRARLVKVGKVSIKHSRWI